MSGDGGAGPMLDRAHDVIVLGMPNATVVRGEGEIRIREDRGTSPGTRLIFHTLMVIFTVGLWLLVLPFFFFVRGGLTTVTEDEGTLVASGDQKARVGALLRKEGLPCR